MMGVLKSDFEMCFCNNNAPKLLDPLKTSFGVTKDIINVSFGYIFAQKVEKIHRYIKK